MRSRLTHVAVASLPYLALHIWLFWEPLSTGQYLAFTDLWDVFLPTFFAPYTPWSSFEYGGFPVFADPQSGHFYPMQQLFSQIFDSWNWYLLTPYVLASSFTYAYVFVTTRSMLAAFVGGLAYGLSEAMQERNPHPTIVQGYMWLPALLVALERFKAVRGAGWFVCATAVVALAILAGHAQTAIYTLAVCALYALVGGVAERKDWRYYGAIVLMFGLGGALTLVQSLPLLEASRYITREQVSFEQFIGFSLTMRDALASLYPMVVHEGREVPVYVGLAVLLFAGIGLGEIRRNWRVGFWLLAIVIGVLLALGEATPFATVAYHVPLYDKFRIVGRHLVFTTFGLISIAGFGLAALPRLQRPVRRVALAGSVLTLLMAAGFWMLWKDRAGELESHTWHWLTSGYYQSTAPLQVFFFVVTIACALALARWRARAAGLALVLVLGADLLGSQFVEITWSGFRFPHLVPSTTLAPSVHTEWLRSQLLPEGRRVVGLHGVASDPVIGGQFSKMWQVPSASGYNSMLLTHFNELSRIGKQGDPDPHVLRSDDVGLDLLGVRYAVGRTRLLASGDTIERHGVRWSEDPLRLTVGRQKCGFAQPATLRLSPQSSRPVSSVAFVGYLRCAEDVTQGATVGAIRIIGKDGSVFERPLRAGVELAEQAHQRSDVKDRVRHQLATVFEGSSDADTKYLVTVALDKPVDVERLEVDQAGFAGWIEIDRLTVIADTGDQMPQAFAPLLLNDPARWREARRFKTSETSDRGIDEEVGNEEEFVVFENLRAMPRAWFVRGVLPLADDDQREAYRLSILPDGARFNPHDAALVRPDDAPVLPMAAGRVAGKVERSEGVNGHLRVEVTGAGGFLTVNEIWYPAWQARIDGQPARIHRANAAFMGVVVPEGQHAVEFTFVPRLQTIGAGLSIGVALLVVIISVVPPVRRLAGVEAV